MAEALVVVDMLRDFVQEGGKLYCGEAASSVVPAVKAEVNAARAEGIPVIYVCDSHRPDDPEFSMFPPHCVTGTPGAQMIDELAPAPGERIINKRRFSGFFATDLDLTLRELGVESIRLVGVCTNICVLYTALDARQRNFRVTVPRQAVASFDPGAHEWALSQMREVLGVEVV